jgi:hypothetical protein
MWFASHLLFSVRFQQGNQDHFPIVERVVLIEAFDHEEARDRAAEMVEREQGEGSGDRRYNGHAAELVYLGVKKSIVLATEDGGTEITLQKCQDLTYWEYDAMNEDNIIRLRKSEAVDVKYIE